MSCGDSFKPPTDVLRSTLAPRWRWLPSALTLGGGAVLSFILFFLLNALDRVRLQADFQQHASDQASVLTNALDDKILLLESIRSFWCASPKVERKGFATFTRPLYSRVTGIQALEWIPRVPDVERSAYEASAREDGLDGFHFTERESQERMIPAARRDEYFPVYYLEPYAGNELALGFDLGSEPKRKATLDEVRATGRVLGTPPVRLVQESSEQAGFLIFVPVYRNGVSPDGMEEGRQDLAGYIVGAFRVGEIVEGALRRAEPKGIDIALYDETTPSQRDLLHFHPSRTRGRPVTNPESAPTQTAKGLSLSRHLNIAGRQWEILLTPAPAFYAGRRHALAWIVLASSLAFTILLAMYVNAYLRRSARIARLANDLKAAEKSLRLTQFAVDTAGESVFWLLRNDGSFFYVNDAACRLSGYSRQELLNMKVRDLDLTHASEAGRAHWERIKRDKSLTFEASIQAKDGRVVPIELTAHYLKYEGQEYNCAFARDITERKRAEQKLVSSEMRYRRLFESAKDGILILHADTGRVVNVNPYMLQMLGCTRETVLGKPLWEIGIFKDAAASQAVFQDMRDRQYVRREDLPLKTCDGRSIDVEFVSNTYLLDQEKVIQCNIRDITERKHAEEEIHALARLVREAPGPVFRVGTDGAILAANPASKRMLRGLGAEKGKRVGRNWLEKFAEIWGEGVPRELDVSFGGRVCSVLCVPVKEAGCLNLYGRDVTEHRKMEAHMRQQQKLESIGTLASGVAHEINNPINGIMNYAQLLGDRLPTDSPLRQYADDILKETDRVALIARNLLAFARNEKQSHSPARLKDIVDAALSLIQAVFRHDNIVLETDVPADLPRVNCRSHQIQQVLMNLLTNARDALNERYAGAGPNKVLRITARELDRNGQKWIRTTVEDRGTGIASVVMANVFDPFFTTKSQGMGTGLGLSISHGIVTEHDGNILIESEIGQYTRVHVDLPAIGDRAFSDAAAGPAEGDNP